MVFLSRKALCLKAYIAVARALGILNSCRQGAAVALDQKRRKRELQVGRAGIVASTGHAHAYVDYMSLTARRS